jgi:tetratricopeptide (TPR) repeat protein
LTFTQSSLAQEDQYKSIIKSANSYFQRGDYLNAKASYQYSLRFKPTDEYAKNKIKECIKKLQNQSPNRIKYSTYLQKAEKFYKNGEYAKAIECYKNALVLFSFEQYPKNQIKKINHKINEEKELLKDYNLAITAGDNYFNEKKYAKARLEYQYALGLLSNKTHPKQRLKEIDFVLQKNKEKLKIYNETLMKAESLFNKGTWKKSLENYKLANKLYPDKIIPINRIKELVPLLAQLEKYKCIIEEADKFYMVKDFLNAKNKYMQASNIKSSDPYPKEMLTKVLLAIKNKVTSELEDFSNAVKMGDLYFKQKQWKESQSQFEFANRLKPKEKYPIKKLAEVAKYLKEEERIALLLKKYNDLITNADLYFEAKEYDRANRAYIEASKLFPEKSYASTKIEEVKLLQEKIAAKKLLNEQYAQAILNADKLYNKKEYISAKLAFEKASAIKINEHYPKNKIQEINLKLKKLAAIQSAEENYSNVIQLADSYFNKEEYYKAKDEYLSALKFKKDEKYPTQQLIKIKTILEKKVLVLQKAYEAKLSIADSLFIIKEYANAKQVLLDALKLKPNENYPTSKINEIDNIVAENYKISKLSYDEYIKEAEQFFSSKMYDRALKAYQEALKILPNERYARTQAKKITDLFEASITAVISNKLLVAKSGEKIQLPFNVIPIKERKSNYLYFLIKSSEPVENLRLLVNYGKDQTKNGGVIIRLDQQQNNDVHLVHIGTQYKWFSQDNNWISIQAEGGIIEVEMIKISKGITSNF